MLQKSQPTQSAHEKSQSFVGIAKDITTRTQAEERFDLYHQFVEAAGEGFGMATLDGIILYVNPALQELLDEPNNERVIGKPFLNYYAPHFQELLKTQTLPQLMETGHWQGETEIRSAKGKTTPVFESYF